MRLQKSSMELDLHFQQFDGTKLRMVRPTSQHESLVPSSKQYFHQHQILPERMASGHPKDLKRPLSALRHGGNMACSRAALARTPLAYGRLLHLAQQQLLFIYLRACWQGCGMDQRLLLYGRRLCKRGERSSLWR